MQFHLGIGNCWIRVSNIKYKKECEHLEAALSSFILIESFWNTYLTDDILLYILGHLDLWLEETILQFLYLKF
jgi:hypothetical protein